MDQISKDDIIIRNVVANVLDTVNNKEQISKNHLELKENQADFIRGHLYKVFISDEMQECRMDDLSEAKELTSNFVESNLVDYAEKMSHRLYEIMSSNMDIPPAMLVFATFQCKRKIYLAILKMDFKTCFLPLPKPKNDVDSSLIMGFMLPSSGTGVCDAVIFDLEEHTTRLIEKKREIDGEKIFYFSNLFLECATDNSQKAKLNTVIRAANKVQDVKDPDDVFDLKKRFFHCIDVENKNLVLDGIEETLFDETNMQEEYDQKLKEYDLKENSIDLSDSSMKKMCKCKIKTKEGIEIVMPMDYVDTDNVEINLQNDLLNLKFVDLTITSIK